MPTKKTALVLVGCTDGPCDDDKKGEKIHPIFVDHLISAVKEAKISDAVDPLYDKRAEGDSFWEEEEEDKENEGLDAKMASLIDTGIQRGKRVVDLKMLKKAVDAVKAYLRNGENDARILFSFKGFVPFLVKCLECGSESSSMQYTTAWIFDEVLTKGNASNIKGMLDPDRVAVPLLVKFLQSSDKTIFEKATTVIARLAKIEVAHKQLMENVSATSLLSPLERHLKGKNPSPQFVQDAADIITELMLNLTALRRSFQRSTVEVSGSTMTVNFKDFEAGYQPPVRFAKLVLPVVSAVLESVNITEMTRRYMIESISMATSVLDHMEPLADSGCCPKIASVFANFGSRQIMVSAAVALGNIALSGETSLLAVLKALKGTPGLGSYWKCMKQGYAKDNKDQTFTKAIDNFLAGVADVVHLNTKGEGINLAIDSGFIEALVLCVKDPEMPADALHRSLCIFQCMLSQLPVKRRDVASDILPCVLAHLKGHYQCGLAQKCIIIVQKLIEGNSDRRDVAIDNDAVGILLNILNTLSSESFSQAEFILKCIYSMMDLNPKKNPGYFVDVPEALKNFFLNTEVALIDNLETAFGILVQFTAYGEDAIGLIFETSLDINVVSMLSSPETPELLKAQLNAMKVAENICKFGNQDYRKELVEYGILKSFERVFTSQCVMKRKLALECIEIFLTQTQLSRNERHDIKKLTPFVVEEFDGHHIETHDFSKIVLERMKKIK